MALRRVEKDAEWCRPQVPVFLLDARSHWGVGGHKARRGTGRAGI